MTPNLNIKPDIKLSVKQTFGLESDMEVDAFSNKNELVPEIDKHYKFDKDTKKRLIRLICRVKGEKVYDEKKEVGDIQIKLEDADLVIKEVLGKMRVENTNVL